MFSKILRLIVLSAPLMIFASNLNADVTGSSGLEVMFYNTHNLFDAEHDEGKRDWTYLPKDYPGKAEYCATLTNPYYREECENSNWTADSVELKINQLTKAVTQGRKTLPNILGLCEVENGNVVGKFADKLGYTKFVVTNSPDTRGIDLALMYRETAAFQFVKYTEHVIEGELITRPTRNILEVEFTVGATQKLLVFVNHWPSQSAPAVIRQFAAEVLQDVIDQRTTENPEVNILVMGDFNVIESDFPHPFKTVTTSQNMQNPLRDVHDLYMRDGTIPREVKRKMTLGSYFYVPGMKWNRLDRFFINSKLTESTGLSATLSKYMIYTPSFLTRTFKYDDPQYYSFGSVVAGIPFRSDMNATTALEAGYSDHFPIIMGIDAL